MSTQSGQASRKMDNNSNNNKDTQNTLAERDETEKPDDVIQREFIQFFSKREREQTKNLLPYCCCQVNTHAHTSENG